MSVNTAASEAPPKRRGRPRKASNAPEPPPIEYLIYATEMQETAHITRPTLLQWSRTDPDFPRLFMAAGRVAALLREWNAFLLKLAERGYPCHDVISERKQAKRARQAAMADGSAPPADPIAHKRQTSLPGP
ncbi:hypothetical protein [Cupriavidus sp. AcVe19-6a]|uniref:hypothetical protein n=1 Tax=Cupriavidus sp. AcVe19-6a TaxID=2821358 RepID=UPI001AE6A45A|nr:hypothetical protein [Cupriavidus sp. AcVe19-6a]MBP0639577.1 hypothetical protein [Cupriavidus sp. AcVe19-6a]